MYQFSKDNSLGRKTESCNFSALEILQGAASFCLNTPAMTPCFNLVLQQGIVQGSCVQSALMVPSSGMLLSSEPSLQLPTLNCICRLARVSYHCLGMSAAATSFIHNGCSARLVSFIFCSCCNTTGTQWAGNQTCKVSV